jgi:hypothetical protein
MGVVPFVFVPRGLVCQGVDAGKPWKEEEKGNQGGESQDGGV